MQTLSGGNWLTASPPSGSSNPRASRASQRVPLIEAAVNQRGLDEGIYYGQITVESDDADNSPQILTAVLNLLAPAAQPDPVVRPTGLLLRTSDVAPQRVTISNLTNNDQGFSAEVVSGASAFSVIPTGRLLLPAAGELRLDIAPRPAGLTQLERDQGFAAGAIDLRFDDFATQRVELRLIVNDAPEASISGQSLKSQGRPPRCESVLFPLFLEPGRGFRAQSTFGVTIKVRVLNGCGRSVTEADGGTLRVTPSIGRPPQMNPNDERGWEGLWFPPRGDIPEFILTATASVGRATRAVAISVGVQGGGGDTPTIEGIAEFRVRAPGGSGFDPAEARCRTGGLEAMPDDPGCAFAPGHLISIFGRNLARGAAKTDGAPWPLQLPASPEAGEFVEVIIQGQRIPLYSVGPGRINAILPYGLGTGAGRTTLPVNQPYQVWVRQGITQAAPQQIFMVQAGPCVLVDERGLQIQKHPTFERVDSSNPVSAGEVIIISATGLGAVQPEIFAGRRGPGPPDALAHAAVALSQADRIDGSSNVFRVTIAGVEARVLFAGLAPTQVGVYQVNAIVPDIVLSPDEMASAKVALVLEIIDPTKPDEPLARSETLLPFR